MNHLTQNQINCVSGGNKIAYASSFIIGAAFGSAAGPLGGIVAGVLAYQTANCCINTQQVYENVVNADTVWDMTINTGPRVNMGAYACAGSAIIGSLIGSAMTRS